MAEFLTMPDKCSGCAFRAGTEASKHSWTVLKAKLCVLTGEEFFCHEPIQELTAQGLPVKEAIERVEETGRMWLCKGWAEAVKAIEARGEVLPEWKRAGFEAMSRVMDKAEDGQWPADETESAKALLDAVSKAIAECSEPAQAMCQGD